MKKAIIMISSLILIYCVGCGAVSDSSEISSETSISSETVVAEKISADDFVKKFASDSTSAESENKDKFFEISGIYEGNLFETTIQMSTSESYDNYSNCELRFKIDKEKFQAIEGLSKGDVITLKAKFKDVVSYTLEFVETEFVNLEKTIPESVETNENLKETVISETTIKTELTEPSEHNTGAYVDYLALKAKADIGTLTDEELREVINWIKEHKKDLFLDNETMEKAMYYGELLEYKYKGTENEYEKLGWQMFKTIKYVYRGEESVDNDTTQNNLTELIEIIENISD
jgi:hypothetical protein